MATIRLTMAQALVRFLAAQKTEIDGETLPLFAGVWAIFGHGNVAGMGEALLRRARRAADLPRPQRAGDGACRHRLCQGDAPPPHDGLHHLDRPRRHQHGDGRGGRACQPPAGAACCRATSSPTAGPIRCCSRSRISATARCRANDCFRPVSRYFDRITRPEQIIPALPAP